MSAPGPWVGLAMFVAFTLAFVYGLGEILLLEHRLYEHGIVFRSLVPGHPTYVVPHYSVDLRSLAVGGRHLNTSAGFEAPDRRYRQFPLVKSTIDFDGLDPKFARKLGKGRAGWVDAGNERLGIKGSTKTYTRPHARWMATFRDPERHLATIRATVAASQQNLPSNQ